MTDATGSGSLDGKRIIVTGAGDGLGRAYATYLAAQGARVVVNDVDPAKAETVAEEITAAGGTAVPAGCSVAQWDSAARIVELCASEFGAVDGLVNNAGVIRVEDPWSPDEASVLAMISVNLAGTVFVGVHAIRQMIAQGGGAILNITSSAQLGLPKLAVYGATKGGIASLTYSWALDTARHGVRVNAYSPVAETAMTSHNPVPGSGIPSPADNAPVVGYLLSDLCSDVTGQVIQRRGDNLVIMAHPDLTPYTAPAHPTTIQTLHTDLGPVLRTGTQPVGDPRVRQPSQPVTSTRRAATR